MRILIVHHDTLGLAHDYRVLRCTIEKIVPGCQFAHLVIPQRLMADYSTALDVEAIEPLAPFDCTILLEHARANPPLLSRTFSKSICYVPNMEWLDAADELVIESGAVDHVWLKNKYSQQLFASLRLSDHVKTAKCVGWTSEDISLNVLTPPEKDFDRFLHVKGASWQKQTNVVMETWADHPEFPELLVTMHGGLDLARLLSYGPNVNVCHRKLEPLELQRLQVSIGVHVIPSGTEGFGHVLNEARAASSVLITSNAPPMNEFVHDARDGMLVAVDAEFAASWGKSRFFPISRESLAVTVERLSRLSSAERRGLGQAARRAYENDRLNFENQVAAAIASWV